MSIQVTPHITHEEILRVSSRPEDTVFRDKPWELAVRMTAVFSHLETVRFAFNVNSYEPDENPGYRRMIMSVDDIYGIILTSYLRSVQKNIEVDGSQNSRHLYAIAIDFSIWDFLARRIAPIGDYSWMHTVVRRHFDYVEMHPNRKFFHADLRHTFIGDVL